MRLLRKFDPWTGRFCTCKPKYSLAPYTGCDHRCLYCYITTYIPNAFNCRPKQDFIKYLSSDLRQADNSIPISIANSSDPYPTIERDLGLTRKTLKILTSHNFKVLLVTKSTILTRDFDIISNNNIVVTVTINSNADELANQLEPGAPPPSKRIAMVEKLISSDVPVMVRVDPLIPGVNHNVDPLLKELSEIGVEQITTSTFKARPDSLKRLSKTFPELGESLDKSYRKHGEFINRSWYLPKKQREMLMTHIYEISKKYNIGFNMCREGLTIPRTSASCDGAHLLKSI